MLTEQEQIDLLVEILLGKGEMEEKFLKMKKQLPLATQYLVNQLQETYYNYKEENKWRLISQDTQEKDIARESKVF